MDCFCPPISPTDIDYKLLYIFKWCWIHLLIHHLVMHHKVYINRRHPDVIRRPHRPLVLRSKHGISSLCNPRFLQYTHLILWHLHIHCHSTCHWLVLPQDRYQSWLLFEADLLQLIRNKVKGHVTHNRCKRSLFSLKLRNKPSWMEWTGPRELRSFRSRQEFVYSSIKFNSAFIGASWLLPGHWQG